MKKTINIAALTMALTGSSLFAATAFIGDDFPNNSSYNTKTSSSLDWVGPWVEFGDSNDIPFSNPDTGTIRITNNTLRFKSYYDFSGNTFLKGTTSIVRALNLEQKTNVILSFDVTETRTDESLKIQFWNNVNSTWVDGPTFGNAATTITVNITDPNLLTKDSKIRILSASGDWAGSNSVRFDPITIDNIKIEFDYTDTDGDNIADNLDEDDDNDGILDIDEQNSQVAGIDITTTWTQNGTNAMNGKLGNQVVDLIDQGNILDDFVTPPSAAFNPYSKTFWSSDTRDSLQAAPSNFISMTSTSTSGGNIGINVPVNTKRVLIHVDQIGATTGGFSGNIGLTTSARFTLNDPANDFVMSAGNSNPNLKVDTSNKYFERITGVDNQTHTDSHPGTNGPTDGSAAGTIIIESNTPFTNLSFNVRFIDENGAAATGADGLYMIIETDTTISGSKDTDGDGVSDEFDLDSDNDGIPDSIEAQVTVTPVYIDIAANGVVPIGTAGQKAGAPNQFPNGIATPLPDKDNDGTPDFLDSDSDGDDIPDCNEGNIHVKDYCPVTTVELDGMSALAGSNGSYGNIFGNVINTEADLFGYISSLSEVAYRIPRVCGNNTWSLTKNQWKTISVPCLINNPISDVFSVLGTYGDSGNWVMYEQTSSFTGHVSQDYPAAMTGNEHMVPGKGYWIITDSNMTVSIDEINGGLSITKTSRTLPVNHSSTSPNFTEVHQYTGLPASSSTDEQKVLLGNPFPVSFHLGDLFVSNDGGANFYPLYDTAHASFTSTTVYIYDHTGRDPVNYVAKTANGTPGFGDIINPGIGFWYRLVPGNPGANKIDYPFNK